ncbi:peptidyl-prolyl cis-trans isomerase NIMA-interacting, putative [Entamoeba dispar SAW760]|uniref:Peptidyl-prolyl cis-trans isomerase n=1 Tax=Entamoeba dispar (strain ATCC PRA-260 / SAW760) TaxID=370354 RepID=B0EEP5_ENTDS|nr:peptidyl-prolyl cis-trans isomerase NIMA-interacting, putative [Entamoeba dispar SAW760]EDR27021.1 peptidyl-prolyl cis-trans isomerase NIMA-interacting, putative [Entamoeba dispar SAW760]|eukprot:EDR27021.1 peptidyl-prolyl cis-trans isomerase NIMA-interacting, putative [Entamoeba dispar SAW760]
MPKGKQAPSKGAKASAKTTKDNKEEKQKGCTKIKVRHILCEKQSKILEALAKLEEGKPFSQVATEYSEDKANQGGSLGWVIRGQMCGAFQDVAFNAPVGKYTQPFKTPFGYHIVLVEERK